MKVTTTEIAALLENCFEEPPYLEKFLSVYGVSEADAVKFFSKISAAKRLRFKDGIFKQLLRFLHGAGFLSSLEGLAAILESSLTSSEIRKRFGSGSVTNPLHLPRA